MTEVLDAASTVLLVAGAFFFTAGTVGLIRFPDARSQLHALTKADNVGLGMILLGVALQLGSWTAAGVLLLTWLFALGASAASAQVVAGLEVRRTAEATPSEVPRHGGKPPPEQGTP